jgi:hypothetical protein
MAYHIKFSIGTTRECIQVSELESRKATARLLLANTFGGFTEFSGYGGWINPTGGLILEPCISLAVSSESITEANKIASELCAIFNQDCVLVTVARLDSLEFVTPL